ncbi:MAG: DUF4870 domain-containing protein [Gemmatales bacterium]|nr:DUF4870 domain-containing protein [Gemmatales bacterium]MDW8222916.1 DUF4870 domain-containing protein [Gemmatales bacterium]
MTSEQEKWLAFACHLGGALGAILFANLGFLVPLIIWLIKREESPHVNHHGKEALNFQLNMLLLGLALYLVLSLLRGSLFRPFDILQWHSLPWFSALLILNLVLSILASIEAYNGKKYSYPFIVRIVR